MDYCDRDCDLIKIVCAGRVLERSGNAFCTRDASIRIIASVNLDVSKS